jgi:hypothetical protein
MSIQELEDMGNKGGVYVENTSPRGQRGDILFSAPKLRGVGTDVVRVIKTWIPQDLTNIVTKEQLLQSSEFRQTVTKGYLKILTKDYASQVLEHSDAKQERDRIENVRRATRNIIRASQTTAKEEDEKKTPTQIRREKNLARIQDESANSEPAIPGETPFDIMLKRLANMDDQTEILNSLRGEGAFTKKELKSIIVHLESFPRVVAWATKKLALL